MKLNLEFCKEQENLKPEEKELNEKIEKNLGNYEIVKERDSSIELMLSLSTIRQNIINWYPLEKNAQILEIGANYGEITGYLCNLCENVTSVELSKEKAKIIEKRHSTKENLECIVGNLENIQINKKFDYVIIIGQIEKASKWLPSSSNPEKDLLLFSSKMLKENGKILLATDNKFGIQYWNGKKDLEGTLEYKNLIEERTKNGSKLFSEKQLKEIIEEIGYKNYKFYYALPDYKMPNLIYSKDYTITKEDISRNFQYYGLDELVNFKENEVYLQLLNENKEIFNFFANSFFVEIGNETIQNDIKYITFSNYRKEKYRIMTIIKDEEVIKKATNKTAQEHINNILKSNLAFNKANVEMIEKEQNGKIVSKYINAERFDIFLEKANEKSFIENFEKYTNILYQDAIDFEQIKNNPELKETIKNYDTSKLEKMKFTENAYLDFIPKNCFLINDIFYVFDQEWVERYMPIEYIIYRAIQNSNLGEEKKKLLNKKYNITENEDLFIKLEEELREKLIDNVMFKEIFNREKYFVATMNHYYNLKNIAEVEKIELQEEIKKLKEEIDNIHNSNTWKVAETLRKIKNIGTKRGKK